MNISTVPIGFDSAIKITSDNIFFTTKDGAITYVNPAFETITGYTSEEVLGKNPRFLQSGRATKDYYRGMWETILAKKPFRAVVCNKKKNGEIYFEEKTITPVCDDTGEITHFVSSGKDITERIRYEEQLKQLVEDLERANKELEMLTRVAAHDLKNPLNGIKGVLDLSLAKYSAQMDEEFITLFHLAQKEANYMNALIVDLLEYFRVGNNQEEAETINLNDLLDEIAKRYTSRIKIKFILSERFPTVLFNKTHLREVFENLIGNAVKFMDKPDGVIKIGWDKKGNEWMFFVEDNGMGIEERYFEKIFDVFVKAHHRKDVESTGVGLSIVRKIVEKARGRIWVESRIGFGSTLYFTIPFQTANP